MAEKTKIEWADATFNPWIGCSPVHTGCLHCYGKRLAGRFGVQWGPNGTRRVTSQATWKQPLAWNRKAAARYVCQRCGGTGEQAAGCYVQATGRYDSAAGTCDLCHGEGLLGQIKRPRVFPSLCDPFESWDGPMVDKDDKVLLDYAESAEDVTVHVSMSFFRRRFFKLIDATPNLDWILLTKRPQNVLRMWPDDKRRENCWLLYSASDQATLEAGLPHLLKCRGLVPVLGVSLEPLVGPVCLTCYKSGTWESSNPESIIFESCDLCGDVLTGFRATSPISGIDGPKIDWVIVGGETGPGARPVHPDWVRSIRDECKAAGVAFTFKSWGKDWKDIHDRLGTNTGDAHRELDGVVHDEWPRGGADSAEGKRKEGSA